MLRNKTTEDVYLVVFFTLYLQEDVNEDGSLKPEALQDDAPQSPAAAAETLDGQQDEDDAKEEPVGGEKAALEEAKKRLGDLDLSSDKDKGKAAAAAAPKDDDID